jgi:hypothetical protein
MATIDRLELTTAQAGAIERAGASERAIEQAQRVLYRALGRPQPLRERKWAERVGSALSKARDAIRSHREEVTGQGGLYDELRFEAPWLLARVAELDAALSQIENEVAELSVEVDRVRFGDLARVGNIRDSAERILVQLRAVLAREADLTWERFNQPPALD